MRMIEDDDINQREILNKGILNMENVFPDAGFADIAGTPNNESNP